MHFGTDEIPSGGTVQVGALSWTWNIIALKSLPEGTVEQTYLFLHDPENSGNSMMLRLRGDFTGLTDAEVAEKALHPLERTVIDHQGKQWIFKPIPSMPDSATVRGARVQPRVVKLYEGATLGDAGNAELLEAAGLT
jgi:hypothetical protein